MSDQGESRNRMIGIEARKALGLKRGAFAKLTGVTYSSIEKRETGKAATPGAAATLYELVVELCGAGLEGMIVDCLSSVPYHEDKDRNERNEGRSVLELVALAYQSGNARAAGVVRGKKVGGVYADEGGADKGGQRHLLLSAANKVEAATHIKKEIADLGGLPTNDQARQDKDQNEDPPGGAA